MTSGSKHPEKCIDLSNPGFWSTPVPYFESKKEILVAVTCFTAFFIAFLLFFQPFGVNNYDPTEQISFDLVIGVLSVGLVVMLILLFNEIVLRPVLIENFTGAIAMVWLLWSLLFISTGVFVVYNIMGGWHDWKLSSYVEFIRNIGVLSLLPVAAIIFFLYQRGLRRRLMRLTLEHQDSDNSNNIVLTADNDDRISMPVEDILFLQSQDNYVLIHYLAEGNEARHILRGTLKRIAQEVEGTPLMRCHRAFIVNTGRVLKFEGNLHRMELDIRGSESRIPVSRNYTKTIQETLQEKAG